MQMLDGISKINRHSTQPLLTALLLSCMLWLAGCAGESATEPTVGADAPTIEGSLAVVAEETETPVPPPTEPVSSTVKAEEPPQVVASIAVTETTEETASTEESATAEADSLPESPGEASLERDESDNCLTEFALDLAGYPDLEESMGCAVQEALFDPVAINEFGEGPDYQQFMLWFGATEQIVALLPNATWQGYLDTWTDAEAEIQCNPYGGVSESPPLPRRGFGKLWCSDSEIQTLMGTIEREERLCQHAVVQRFEQGRLVACFEDATIRYFRILEDGSWSHLFVQ